MVAPRYVAPYRRYSYPSPYRSGFSLGFYGGYPYSYYPYPYASYGYYGGYYGGYPSYGPPVYGGAYIAGATGAYSAYGSVRIEGAPRDAQVFADGYYVGVVDNFDGTFQHLNLTAGPHRVEIRVQGQPPIAFDVRVEPGQTITYRANP